MRPKEIKPYKKLLVHFETMENYIKLLELIKQKPNLEIKELWYPEMTVERYKKLRYKNEP